MRKLVYMLLGLVLVNGCGSSCNKPSTGVYEACESYARMRDCEAQILHRVPVHLNCKSLQKKFETICSQTEIDYAAKVFAEDGKRLCAMKSPEELKTFKSTFDVSKISAYCYQAASDCGPECFQTGLDDVP